jgi:hypothetical protein
MKSKLNSVTGMGKTYTYEITNEISQVMGITGRPPHETILASEIVPRTYKKQIYNKGSKYHK